MKKSFYNFSFEVDGRNYIYNAMTNALAELSRHEKKSLDSFKCNKHMENSDFIHELKYGGFVIDDYVDELNVIKEKLLRSRYSSNELDLVIAPTLGCNFRCAYCFENTQSDLSIMSEDVQNQLVNFTRNQLHHKDALNVTWYGGEPLLAMQVIEDLTKQFIALSSELEVEYRASMVTNGFLINEAMFERLKECHVNHMQITLDGVEEGHDVRRPLQNGGSSFYQIVNGLQILAKNVVPVSLRVNVDRRNQGAFEQVVSFLAERNLLENISPYPGIITDLTGFSEDKVCFNMDEIYTIEESAKTILNKRLINDHLYDYPISKSNYCGADQIDSFVVDPYGYIYPCWDEIGRRECAISHVSDKQQDSISMDRSRYLLYDVTEDPFCRDCRVLPICMGGCPHQRISGHHDCIVEKEYLLERLKYYIEHN